ncbi:FAD-binding domain-containing protein [Rhodocollybia butyracea]|uniref:FAD-binding domain-containing protein n=1 Tax=Rhodocollybia butyracea TaxID=206335 RepID=A0A9P5PTN8_9AGAR|nr:FAD-binding domain-containing protein [Rhodocollybia butyracea]
MKVYTLIQMLLSATLSFAQDQNATMACSSIENLLGPTKVQSSGLQFEAGATGAWNLANAQLRPACIVFPLETSDVQVAMKSIFKSNARYAVQAGGHSAMEGWDNSQGGVLILFSQMNNISYNQETNTISMEPGLTWGEATNAMEPFGVAPVGGRASAVGTGLLLGGGISFLSPAHGFGADNIKCLDVVLVDGTLVVATVDNEYADLFRALKGGGSRYGIVTKYELYAVHTGTSADKPWIGGTIVYPSSSVEAVINATAHYVQTVGDPRAVSLVNVIISGEITAMAQVELFYNVTDTNTTTLPSSIFGELLSIPASSTNITQLSYLEVLNTNPAGNNSGSGETFGAGVFSTAESTQVYLDARAHWDNFTQAVAGTGAYFFTSLIFTPIPSSQVEAGRARGGNAIHAPLGGYVALNLGDQLTLGVAQPPPEADEAKLLFLNQLHRSPGFPFFMNECDKRQNVYETYGDYEFMKKTYMKYDPTRFIVEHMSGPPGL